MILTFGTKCYLHGISQQVYSFEHLRSSIDTEVDNLRRDSSSLLIHKGNSISGTNSTGSNTRESGIHPFTVPTIFSGELDLEL